MPTIKSSKKRVKVAEKKEKINREWKNQLKNSIKQLEKTVDKGNVEEAREQLVETTKIIDKCVNKNIIHKNNAARKKSRLTKMVNSLEEN